MFYQRSKLRILVNTNFKVISDMTIDDIQKLCYRVILVVLVKLVLLPKPIPKKITATFRQMFSLFISTCTHNTMYSMFKIITTVGFIQIMPISVPSLADRNDRFIAYVDPRPVPLLIRAIVVGSRPRQTFLMLEINRRDHYSLAHSCEAV